jgi:metal-dependent amidase/aminoacylase/carboxypeptidase family protein
LKETSTKNYPQRTEKNVQDSRWNRHLHDFAEVDWQLEENG